MGQPYFSTDSTAVVRALELHCDCVVKGTKVDGIYDKDPKKFADAQRYDILPLKDALHRDLRVMDQTAIALAHDEDMPIYVCHIDDIDKILSEEIVGTFVHTKSYIK